MLLSRVAGLKEATTRPGRSGECRAENSRSSNVPGLLLLRPHHLVIGEERAGVGVLQPGDQERLFAVSSRPLWVSG